MIEPGTAFGDRYANGKLKGLPGENLGADLFEMTQEMTRAAGFMAYEVSNHAQISSESRHNLVYWRYGDYAGIGPGAHGRVTLPGGQKMLTEAISAPAAWLRQQREGRAERREVILGAEQASEYLMMGLRIDEGISLSRFETLAEAPLNQRIINDLASSGLLRISTDRIHATERGRMVLNAVIRELMV
jgi:oxygen-independent coproporphyrinogen-3 oxidase